MRALLVLVALVSLAACGGAPAGPSPVAAAAPAAVATAAAAPPALPAGLDPAWLRALLSFDSAGFPQRWEGGPFSHCGAVDPALAAELSDLSGIQQGPGPCNVEWVRLSGAGHPTTVLRGTERALVYARVTLYDDDRGVGRHELGHVLGLNHSPRRSDLMAATPTVDSFSAEELALLAWLYPRAR